MAVLQMLTEVVGSEELLRLVAFPKLVDMVQVLGAYVPLWRIREFFSTIAADVYATGRRSSMKCGFYTSKCSARP